MAVGEYSKFIPQLSKRELEVIEAVLAGSLRYKSIASSLNISVNTVKTHLRKIYLTVGVNSIEALATLFQGYSKNKEEITPKSPLKIAKSPRMGDRKQHVFAVIFYNIMHSGGKKMQNFKALKIRTKFAIPLVLVIALVIGFAAGKLVSGNRQTSLEIGVKDKTVPEGILVNFNEVSDFPDIEISAEAVSEGILVTFSNYSNIPLETEQLIVSFVDWGSSEYTDWESDDPLVVMNSMSIIRMHQSLENILEQVRQTGTVTFPFVQPGRKYSITAAFSNSNGNDIVKVAKTECVADRGIYLNKDIALNMNNARNRVTFSSKPAFTSDDHFEYEYFIAIHKGNYTEAITSGITNDLIWNFEPKFSEHLKEAGVVTGDYPAFAGAHCIIIHDNVSWLIEIDKTPVFIYSL